MAFYVSKLKISTKSLIAFLIGLGSLMQVPAIENPVMAFAAHHPHVATIIAALTAIIGLLHNPTVDAILGIKQTVTSQTFTLGDVSKTDTVSTTITPVTSGNITAAGEIK